MSFKLDTGIELPLKYIWTFSKTSASQSSGVGDAVMKFYSWFGTYLGEYRITAYNYIDYNKLTKNYVENKYGLNSSYFSYNYYSRSLSHIEDSAKNIEGYTLVDTVNYYKSTYSYFNNKTFNGLKLINFQTSEHIQTGNNANFSDVTDIYYFKNGLVESHHDFKEFSTGRDSTYLADTYSFIYKKNDTRIETDCCIDVELYPNKYKLKV